MNKLSEKEFRDRIEAIGRARRIFLKTGITDNITEAFRIYQEILAEQKRELWLTSAIHGDRPHTYLDGYDRPECPDCGANMMFRATPKNSAGVQTQLVCSNPECDLVLNSEKSMSDWEKELKKKDED
jgi:hypothetical protein